MTFRIFTNDRGKVRGVPMYSALCELQADNRRCAELEAKFRFRRFWIAPFAPGKVIEWPPIAQASKDWLAKHVG